MIESTPDVQKEMLTKVVSSLLGNGTHSEAELREVVDRFRPVAAPVLDDDEVEAVVKDLTQRLLIDVDLGVAVTSKDFVSWLPSRKAEINWERWQTYKQWSLNGGRAPKVVDKMDQLTDEILDLVGDPTAGGTWGRRGLVIGDVQSGKTATYLGLFNKAADAGYRLIIVLAGSTESLRQQTQARLDEGFIGRDSRQFKSKTGVAASPTRHIGIGLLNQTVANAQGMTTVMQDFKRSSQMATNITVDAHTAAPYVFVVKKNKSVLKALQDWLAQQAKSQGKLEIPVLLLDDESDYASVNTREEESPTAINAAIRGILGKFSRSSYLAFTATPFANIFIDHDNDNDLFPRDFVYGLEAPTNYVGAERVFGTIDAVDTQYAMDISDAGAYFPPSHKSWLDVGGLPESLRSATRVFLLGNALRDLRGDKGGRSMLINVSRFKAVQRQVFELVEDYSVEVRNAIELHSKPFAAGRPNATLSEMETTFEDVYSESGATWPRVLEALPAAVADIRVELHNSDRDLQLIEHEITWERPPRMIAVGGDVLSRGLTLDGLMVSYFYRRVGAFDTLMQMARWFGYRDGYEDLCRIWIDEEIASDYRFVDDAVKELRDDLAVMKNQRLTPSDFGLAIKKHPGALLVTARNKMRSATTHRKSVSLAGRRIESTKLACSVDVLRTNSSAFEALLESLSALPTPEYEHRRKYNWWSEVSKVEVAGFLEVFRADQSDPIWLEDYLSRFVKGSQSPALQTWDVVLVNGAKKPQNRRNLGGTEYWLPERSVLLTGTGHVLVSGSSSRLAGSGDVASLLTTEQQDLAERAYRARRPEESIKALPETAFYAALNRPAMFIYPLQVKSSRADTFQDKKTEDQAAELEIAFRTIPGVAVKIAIPGDPADVNNRSGDVEYVINTVAQQNWLSELVEDVDVD